MYNIANAAADTSANRAAGVSVSCTPVAPGTLAAVPAVPVSAARRQDADLLPYCDLLVEAGVDGYTLVCGADQASVSQCSELQVQNGISGGVLWSTYIQGAQIYLSG